MSAAYLKHRHPASMLASLVKVLTNTLQASEIGLLKNFAGTSTNLLRMYSVIPLPKFRATSGAASQEIPQAKPRCWETHTFPP